MRLFLPLLLLLPSPISSLRFGTFVSMPFTTMTRQCFLYSMEKRHSEECEGSKAYEGLCIDLIKALANELNSTYSTEIGKSGAGFVRSNGSWSDLIGDVVSGAVDVAVAPIAVTPERAAAVDLTPFYASGISLMIRKPFPREPKFDVLDCLDRLTWLNPYSAGTWIVILAAELVALATAAVLYRFYRKAEADRRWRLLILLCWLIVWIGCTVVLVCSTVHFICTIPVLTEDDVMPHTVEKLVERGQVMYGMQRGGLTHRLMDTSSNPVHKTIMEEIEKNGNHSFVADYGQGISHARMSRGRFAFLLDAAAAEYEQTRRPCDVMTIGEPLIKYDFAVATKKDSELSGRVASAIDALKSAGELDRLREKWFVNRTQCGRSEHASNNMNEVEWGALRDVYVMIGGAAIAIIASLILSHLERKRRENPAKRELMDEESPMNKLCPL